MIDFFVRRTLTAHGYFSSGSNFWCLLGEWFDFHHYISMIRVSYIATPCLIIVICHLLLDPLQPLCHLVSSFGLPRTPWLDDGIYEQPLILCKHPHFESRNGFCKKKVWSWVMPGQSFLETPHFEGQKWGYLLTVFSNFQRLLNTYFRAFSDLLGCGSFEPPPLVDKGLIKLVWFDKWSFLG